MSKENNQTQDKQTLWTDLNLDDRILKAIEKAKFPSPTPIQARTIPLALSGCDILARAKTGSGKTLAASIPIIQHILRNTNEKGINAFYLVPTKELGEQVYQHFLQITSYCKDVVTCYHILGTESPETRKMHLRELPRIIIGTPFQLVKALEANEMDVKKSLQFVVMDEADYLLVDQMSQIQKLKKLYFPPVVQCIMMSATLSKELNEKKSILLTNPKVVALGEKESLGSQGKNLKQYFIDCSKNAQSDILNQKMMILFYLIRFKLAGGKVLVFVNGIETAYKAHAVLTHLDFKDAAVLSDAYPVLSRYDIIDKFNKTDFSVLITTDKSVPDEKKGIKKHTEKRLLRLNEFKAKKGSKRFRNQPIELTKDQLKLIEVDKDIDLDSYDVSRGIDFNRVAAVINFDLPKSPESYVHQVGRTARGSNAGISITLLTGSSVEQHLWESIVKDQKERGNKIREYHYDLDDALQYMYRIEGIASTKFKNIKKVKDLAEKQQLKNAIFLKKQWNQRALKKVNHTRIGQTEIESIPEYLEPDEDSKDKELERTGLLDEVNKVKQDKKEEKEKTKKRKRQAAQDPLKKFEIKPKKQKTEAKKQKRKVNKKEEKKKQRREKMKKKFKAQFKGK